MGIYERNYYREESELNLAPSWNGRSAVSTLVIANVAVFILNMLFNVGQPEANAGPINGLLSLRADDWSQPWYWWRLITNGFVHDTGTPFHLVFNMLGLYFLGRSVEDKYGTMEFYRIYFVALLICSASWLLLQLLQGRHDVLLGASGAVICIEMLFVFNFPTARIILLVFPVPAWVLGVILVLSNFFTTQTTRAGTSVAYDVHVVGILCAVAYFFLKLNFRFMENPMQAWRRTMRRLTGPKLKVHTASRGQSSSKLQSDAEEADRILAKIHATGQDSLTSREKKFLENYSRTVRERQKE
ncbi:MAG: rhomboid family intramembrane serine protease [Pirellula sp.]